MALLAWVLAVTGLMMSRAPISSLDKPAPTSATTSPSRPVRVSNRSTPIVAGSRRRENSSMCAIAVINAFDRGNVIVQRPAGDYQPSQFG